MRDPAHRGGPLDIGLGWYSAESDGSFVEHLGGGSGFWNAIRLYPEAALGIVVMRTATHYDHETILATLAHPGRVDGRSGLVGGGQGRFPLLANGFKAGYGGFVNVGPPVHANEPHLGSLASRLNWLRAGVLGANDGIVSVAGIVVGVAGAISGRGAILTAGVAGVLAGAVSMALGEYVSVSSQRDTERALLDKERRELAEAPDEEFAELVSLYQGKGLSEGTARAVAEELTAHDAFAAHVDVELQIDPDNLTNPWHAAFASAAAFTLGSLLPLMAILLPPASIRVPVTFVAVLAALALTGAVSARLGDTSRRAAVVRVVVGGALGMSVTYGVGTLIGGFGL